MKPPRHGPLNDYPRDDDDWPLCRYCGERCPTRRNTFCSRECVHEWKIRSSASYARDAVAHRDKGVCAACGTDTTALMGELRRLRDGIYRGRTSEEHMAAARNADAEAERLLRLGFNCRGSWSAPLRAGQFWQMDHITPVAHGGGMAGLDNLQTLCTPCHKKKTAEQAKARRKEVV